MWYEETIWMGRRIFYFRFIPSSVALKSSLYLLLKSFTETQTCLLSFGLLIISSNITANLRHFFSHQNFPIYSLAKECVQSFVRYQGGLQVVFGNINIYAITISWCSRRGLCPTVPMWVSGQQVVASRLRWKYQANFCMSGLTFLSQNHFFRNIHTSVRIKEYVYFKI